LKRILIAIFALALIAAAPANPTAFVFDERIPAANQQLLEQSLATALASETDRGATVTISLRVIEPELERGMVVAGAADAPRQQSVTPAERSR
jgi:hypothetical protein